MVVQVGDAYRAGSLRSTRLMFTFNTLLQSTVEIRPPGPTTTINKPPSQPALHNSEPKKDPILELKIPAPQASKNISQNPRIPGILQ